MKKKRLLLPALLVVCVLVQGVFLLRSSFPRQILEVWKTIGGPAAWRRSEFQPGPKIC